MGVGEGENRHFSRATRSVSCARFAHTLAKIIEKKNKKKKVWKDNLAQGCDFCFNSQLVPGPSRLSSVPNLEYDAAFENVSGPR